MISCLIIGKIFYKRYVSFFFILRKCVEKYYDFLERCVIYYFIEYGKKVRMDFEYFLNFDFNFILVCKINSCCGNIV